MWLLMLFGAASVSTAHAAPDSVDAAARLVAEARASRGDSARIAYERAAAAVPVVADWLWLRAASVTSDSAARAADYARVRSDVARARIPWTESAARERAGDLEGAIRAYRALGAESTVRRLRVAAASNAEARAALRHELIALVSERGGTAEAREGVALLDDAFAPLTAREELLVARSAAASGPAARVVAGYRRALGGRATLVAQDRFYYGSALSRIGRDADAAAQFALVRSGPLAGRAAYQQARSLLRAGRGDVARKALERVIAAHASDTVAAPQALYLLADLATDDRRDAEARRLFLQLASHYPGSALAPAARFRAALIAFVAGSASASDVRAVAAELDRLAERYPNADDALAAMYWSGRAWERAGDDALARDRFARVLAREPLSYYAMLAARRLGVAGWTPPAEDTAVARDADVDAALDRAATLERIGLAPEAGYEYARLAADAERAPARMLLVARAFRDRGLAARAISLARRALARGAPATAGVYRLLYPLPWGERLAAEAEGNALDPALLAALIRQESGFDPAAVSSAGAVGLMQLMPDVARRVAAALHDAPWEPSMLRVPETNLRLGAAHLAGLLKEDADVGHVLAAYNAGSSRVARWLVKSGTEDPEVFVERIPFTETRDYVRIVQRNRAIYRALYDWPAAAVSESPAAWAGARRPLLDLRVELVGRDVEQVMLRQMLCAALGILSAGAIVHGMARIVNGSRRR